MTLDETPIIPNFFFEKMAKKVYKPNPLLDILLPIIFTSLAAAVWYCTDLVCYVIAGTSIKKVGSSGL